MIYCAASGKQMTPDGSGVIVANLHARGVIMEHGGSPRQESRAKFPPSAKVSSGLPDPSGDAPHLPEPTRTPVLWSRDRARRRAVTADLDATTLRERAHGDSQTARNALPATGALCPAPTSGMS